ncbi:hypothetical protein FACS189449_13250 [Alphaproteobacteria bacterium]|nr:hypothetical protein FACS189449_13250 [Alphaproteobacteria bacterium]
MENKKFIFGLLFLVGCEPRDYSVEYAHLDCDQLDEKYNEILNKRDRHFDTRMQHNDSMAVPGALVGVLTGKNSLYAEDSHGEMDSEARLAALRKLLGEKKCNECKSCGGNNE